MYVIINRGAYAAIVSFLAFSMIQFRDGPFIRPHPAFWRIALGLNLLYELALVFLLFQDLPSARGMMKLIDPSLGVELVEKSYAENCEFTVRNVWVRRPVCLLTSTCRSHDPRLGRSGYVLCCAYLGFVLLSRL